MGVLSSILGHLKRPYFGSHQIYMKKLAGTFSVCFFILEVEYTCFFLKPQPWFVGGNRRVVGGFELVLCDNIHFSMFLFSGACHHLSCLKST